MRHLLANLFTYALAALLVVGSAVFAWIRSSQLVVSNEASVLARFEETEDSETSRRALGARSYEANCRRCHTADGSGWDQYPPVAGISALAAAPGGRDYLISLHLFGIASDRWRAPMPPMGHIPDVELAAVITHVLTQFGNAVPEGFAPITHHDIAVRRGMRRSPAQVNAMRPVVR